MRLKKKIKSKAYVRSSSSVYVRARIPFIRTLGRLGIVTDMGMSKDKCLDGKERWVFSIESEVSGGC
jgi:hypothetical protein